MRILFVLRIVIESSKPLNKCAQQAQAQHKRRCKLALGRCAIRRGTSPTGIDSLRWTVSRMCHSDRKCQRVCSACGALTHGVRVHGAVGVVGNGAGIQAREDAQLGQPVRQHAHRQVVHVPQLRADPARLDALPAKPPQSLSTIKPSACRHARSAADGGRAAEGLCTELAQHQAGSAERGSRGSCLCRHRTSAACACLGGATGGGCAMCSPGICSGLTVEDAA